MLAKAASSTVFILPLASLPAHLSVHFLRELSCQGRAALCYLLQAEAVAPCSWGVQIQIHIAPAQFLVTPFLSDCDGLFQGRGRRVST